MKRKTVILLFNSWIYVEFKTNSIIKWILFYYSENIYLITTSKMKFKYERQTSSSVRFIKDQFPVYDPLPIWIIVAFFIMLVFFFLMSYESLQSLPKPLLRVDEVS